MTIACHNYLQTGMIGTARFTDGNREASGNGRCRRTRGFLRDARGGTRPRRRGASVPLGGCRYRGFAMRFLLPSVGGLVLACLLAAGPLQAQEKGGMHQLV